MSATLLAFCSKHARQFPADAPLMETLQSLCQVAATQDHHSRLDAPSGLIQTTWELEQMSREALNRALSGPS